MSQPSTFCAGGQVSIVGLVVSSIVKVLLAEVPVLPQASVEVQWAVITRVPPQPGVLLSSTYVGVDAPLQVSLALAPFFQVFKAVVLPAPSHSTIWLAGAVTVGGVVSLTVMVWVQVLLWPQESVAL